MKVGIIGAGTMGSGIAQAFAQTEGYEVYLCDINEEFAAKTAFSLRILLLCPLQKSVQAFLIRLSECTSLTRLLL